MRIIGTLYGPDTRPERPDGWDDMTTDEKAKAKKAAKAKDGFRTKSGTRALGQKASFDVKHMGEAVEKAAELLSGLDEKQAAQVTRVKLEVEESDTSTGNPWAV